ncbi:aldehyde dehydrogenase [Fomitiporia mediterranea MF3/22]|uniref:aldehyde dehydrogenase n=1 Tax=Fomitiporia mediterranea (strain MF3/22) TaxID=694068 RepID=UPI0004409A26|nr:aldehyde dehydrogenase [Fomitiporia mediterranea MF3/22]EJD05454.1 aldehyde dehydrogenase [Fomitiporia mediterranea MF3/22]
MALPEVPLWINGERRSASDHGTFDVRNPLTKEVVVKSASATSQDCKAAVEAAQKALDSWEHTHGVKKRAVFIKAAELLQTDKYKQKIAKLLREETAAADSWVTVSITGSYTWILETAGLCTQIKGETYPSVTGPGGHVLVQRRAHGVILSIAPWNAPINLSFRAILIPLACGNTVVLKSSEFSPASQEIVVELMHEAGLPPGVLNYVSMSRETSPALTTELIGHPFVRHVNFTGSDRVGRLIAQEAAKYLKPCVFELGGKAPAVVLEDADIEAAARCIADGALANSGQVCMSTERVIVQRGAVSSLLPALQKHFQRIRAGDTYAQSGGGARIPPLINEGSAESVLNLLREAQGEGAEILVGDLKRDGAVLNPHIVSGIRPGMRAFDRESFGPVVGVTTVDTVEEAVELANTTDYSLTASVWTRDIVRGLEVAPRIRAGLVSINGSTYHGEPGWVHAGLGGATGYGKFDIENFTYKRAIVVHPAQGTYPLVDNP